MISPTYLLNYLGDIKGDVFSIYRTEHFPRNRRADGYVDQSNLEGSHWTRQAREALKLVDKNK